MKRTVTLAIAICFVPVSASPFETWSKFVSWAGFEWKELCSPVTMILGVCPERVNFFGNESVGNAGPHFFWFRGGPSAIADLDLSVCAARFKSLDDTSDISQKGNFSCGLCWGVQPWSWIYRGRDLPPTKADWPDGYRFEIGATSFTVVKRLAGKERLIVPPTRSQAIKSNFDFADAKSWNRLRVKRTGVLHTVWINGIQVSQFADADLPIGYFAFKSEDGEPSLFSFGSFSAAFTEFTSVRRWMKYE